MHYPHDANTYGIETQFFYGPSILVNPVTEESSSSVSFYLPKATWFDFATQKPVSGAGTTITYSDVAVTDIPVLVRGGSIIPLRVKGAMTTKALREEDFEFWVAPGDDGGAVGTLYLDDGESLVQGGTSEINMRWDGQTIRVEGTFGFQTKVGVKSVTILGDQVQKYDLDESLDGPWEHRVR
jgi:alpha-glucosidase